MQCTPLLALRKLMRVLQILPVSSLLYQWERWRIALGLKTQPQAVLDTELPNFNIYHRELQAPQASLMVNIFLSCCWLHTQTTLRRYQNSFCLFICICITAASAVFMFSTALSSLGNKSTMRRLHTRIVLQKRKTRRTGDKALHRVIHFLWMSWIRLVDHLP